MPATITHAYFAEDIYEILPNDIKKNLDLNRLKTFAQGPDSLMFYHLLSFLPGKKIRQFQFYFHTHKTQEFFINLLKNIKLTKDISPDVYAFLLGFITHYCLDTTIHPYIAYKTGIFNKKKPYTYKYNHTHAIMETIIDNDIIQRRLKINPYTYKFKNLKLNLKPFSKDLENIINKTFEETYNIKNMSKIYYHSLIEMNFYIKLFRQDKSGFKKTIYKTIDKITPKSSFRLESVSYHTNQNNINSILNKEHKLWRNPTDFNKTSTKSFPDLYIDALTQAKNIIKDTYDYLDNKKINLKKTFDNSSYLTGLDCSKEQELKYFEY